VISVLVQIAGTSYAKSQIVIMDTNQLQPTKSETTTAFSTTVNQPLQQMSVPLGGYDAFVHENILRDILTDEQYTTLRKYGLLNEKILRDYHIRRTFKELRSARVSAHHAIEHIQKMYPYLQFDTLRKIVYQISDRGK
jgi:hypothetical protein